MHTKKPMLVLPALTPAVSCLSPSLSQLLRQRRDCSRPPPPPRSPGVQCRSAGAIIKTPYYVQDTIAANLTAVRLLQVLPRAITTLLRRMKVHAACAQSKYTEQDSLPESCIRPTPAIDGWRVGHAAFSRSVAATVTGRADSAGVRRCRSTEASARIDCASSRATASSA